jgi:hypothetical protein
MDDPVRLGEILAETDFLPAFSRAEMIDVLRRLRQEVRNAGTTYDAD